MALGLTVTANTSRETHRYSSVFAKGNFSSPKDPDATDEITFPNSDPTAAEADPAARENEQAISELRSSDLEVRAHEAAHMAAGGSHITGGATYSYQTGPDGKRYAVGGEVGIDVSAVPGNPRATIAKMMMVRAAALAPASPSPQDLSVAAAAAQMEADARADLARQNQASVDELSNTGKASKNPYRLFSRRVGQHVNTVA